MKVYQEMKLICRTEKYLKIFPYFHQRTLKYFRKNLDISCRKNHGNRVQGIVLVVTADEKTVDGCSINSQ